MLTGHLVTLLPTVVLFGLARKGDWLEHEQANISSILCVFANIYTLLAFKSFKTVPEQRIQKCTQGNIQNATHKPINDVSATQEIEVMLRLDREAYLDTRCFHLASEANGCRSRSIGDKSG